MSMGTLYATRGLPASGKTTWARARIGRTELGRIVRLNRDDLRLMALPAGYGRPAPSAERQVTLIQRAPIPALLTAGADVIVDDTNLRAKFLREIAAIAWEVGAGFEVVEFTSVPLDVCVDRDRLRIADGHRGVGEAVIREMHGKFLAGRNLPLPVPTPQAEVVAKPYTPVPGTTRAVMVDIDGTLANHGDRDPYDTGRYHQDTPHPAVVEVVRMEHAAGHQVIYCSGRAAEFRGVTAGWIREHVAVEGRLLMRATGDKRNDAVVKLELFDRYIRDHYDVRRVYDDRDRVVRAWRSIGLVVLQVADGAF